MQIQDGNTVSVHYTGTLANGDVFDSSINLEPLQFVVGQGMLIAGFENALLGHKVGDQIKVTIPAAEAYGEHLEDLLMEVPRQELPDHITLEVGAVLHVSAEMPGEGNEPNEDQDMEVIIHKIGDEFVTLDANHPLAGQDLTFEITIISIQ